ncbi:branched-chain-amino-acid transaminase [Photorhabdus kleinii]|uniref:branched-chain-amino-acid transaminase n=1 Tax=Photorhabdus TaxID=29487 RepID=UPI0021D4D6BC|nr:branched-chain-amino-acid transaminase [Photorhabdus kleinii]MCT8343488.1 branched-chain-amino-acid transaminase [Photorhabdus kleinii]
MSSTHNTPEFAWLNGECVPWEKCTLHARTQGAFWGANVFEGVRVYWNKTDKQMYMYRIREHIKRLRDSMKCVDMPVTFTDQEIVEACIDLVRKNNFKRHVHLVIAPYFAMGKNFDPLIYTEDTGMHITALPMPRSARYETGMTASFSTWRRISDDSMPPRIKTGANYHNSRLAQHEAMRNGFDTAFFLNHRGTVAEGPGSCIMMVKNNRLITPPGSAGVLEGITVDSIIRLAKDKFSVECERREIDRTELYLADEVFTCGTLAEIVPVISVDRKSIGDGRPGLMTRKLQVAYEDEVMSNSASEYSTPVY